MCVRYVKLSQNRPDFEKKLSHGQGHGTPTLYSPLSSFVTHYFLRSQIFLLEWTEGFFCLCCDESLMKKLPGWHICFHKCWMKKTKDFLESLSSPARRSKSRNLPVARPTIFYQFSYISSRLFHKKYLHVQKHVQGTLT